MATSINDSAPPNPGGGNVGSTLAFKGAMQTTSQNIDVINNDAINDAVASGPRTGPLDRAESSPHPPDGARPADI